MLANKTHKHWFTTRNQPDLNAKRYLVPRTREARITYFVKVHQPFELGYHQTSSLAIPTSVCVYFVCTASTPFVNIAHCTLQWDRLEWRAFVIPSRLLSIFRFEQFHKNTTGVRRGNVSTMSFLREKDPFQFARCQRTGKYYLLVYMSNLFACSLKSFSKWFFVQTFLNRINTYWIENILYSKL